MNARLPASALPLQAQTLQTQVDDAWRTSIVPELQRDVRRRRRAARRDPVRRAAGTAAAPALRATGHSASTHGGGAE